MKRHPGFAGRHAFAALPVTLVDISTPNGRESMAPGAGCFAPIAGRRVQYVGRTGDVHVEPFPAARA
jgi:hypothetical protein